MTDLLDNLSQLMAKDVQLRLVNRSGPLFFLTLASLECIKGSLRIFNSHHLASVPHALVNHRSSAFP